MYVCLCNGITDRQLVGAAAEFAFEPSAGDPSSFAERIADRLGAGLGCGACRDFAIDLVEQAAARRTSVLLPARGRVPSGLDLLQNRRPDPASRLPAGRKDGAPVPRGA